LGSDNLILNCDATISHTPPDSKHPLGTHTGCENLLLFDIDERKLIFSSDGSDTNGIYMSPFSSKYLTLGSNNNKLLVFNKDDFYLKSPSGAPKLTIDIKNGTINLPGDNNIIGGENLLNVGKLKINMDGEVYYNNKTLTSYIKSLIEVELDEREE
jgi:hypothetical protein